MWTFFSIMATGGAHGRDVGIGHGTINRDGITIGECRRFTEGSLQVGEMITVPIAGRDIDGPRSEYPITSSSATGVDGKETSIGKSNRSGVWTDGIPGHPPRRSVGKTSKGTPGEHRFGKFSMTRKVDKRTDTGKTVGIAAVEVKNPGHIRPGTTRMEGAIPNSMRAEDMESIPEKPSK
ncbi:hypothetical protein [Desulforhabdus sp. TSK]|uniref:hypothetical protein n=1 Tax=Desulforhabdus sp. TSK TaxID=2925014 RepID=UPI001FC88382|nr:hypothetical protein [Desulforhabdus sp. TSK]